MIINITDMNAPELSVYARLTEAQLLSRRDITNSLFIAESPKVINYALDADYTPVSLLMGKKHIDGDAKSIIDRVGDIPVYTADDDILSNITGFELTRGVLCAMKRKTEADFESIIKDKYRICVLEKVTNPTNIGAIFRSAAALYADAVILTTSCCDPLYRRAARVSMGTVFQVPWAYIDDELWQTHGQEILHGYGYITVAMALSQSAVSIDDDRLHKKEKLAVVLGAEGDGLRENTVLSCDYTAMIPMSHGVDSLNVAAASAVAFWELRRR